ncbi:VWA domain-containing protein [Halosimplex rubrum]|uniref:VWA domain-containing protein n=1 Tax=Halosimplex rubrum TaxID=869889 RepID=A0A7D5T4S2_9EURY|nr:VWA domain-containing protein [Halosimplex rubrum]QLH77229.1 VWA domain-containing protein [Halosimplex rubrum]
MGPLGRIGALGCVLMLVMAAIPPVVGGTTGSAAIGNAGNEATLAGAGNVPSGPPAALKAEAAAAIDNASVEKQRFASARDRAYDRINGTLNDYRDPVRLASMQSFTDDAVGVQALAKLARSEANVTALRASRYVAVADNRTTYRTILDARRALNQTEGELENRGVRRSAEAHFDNAQRQFDRAQRRLDRANRSDGRQAISQYAQAIRALRTSWQQAQQSLHMIDREVDPSVAIVNRADPIRNGSEDVNRSVGVRFSDPRPWTLGNLTVYVDGERRRSQPVDRLGNGPMENRTVGVPVRLSERVANVTVAVTDSDVKPGTSGTGGQTVRATATLLLDGDGLSESTEAALGTDPLDPDSDSTETDRDESDDGVIDGHADFDRDGLGTLSEFDLGTDPLVADTDDDGLRDGIEQLFLPTDPLNPDTDDDGTLDGAEDRDGDSLTTAEEIDAGSSPFRADTDGDGLADLAEVNGETNVTDPDTDDDGLLDGVEGTEPFETDPLDPDTDGDGVLDGNETFTTTTGNESLGVSIDVTGEGNVAGTTTIRQGDQGQFDTPQVANITATPVVSIQSQRDFERANITFSYEESALPRHNESRLGVFRWNDTVQGFVPVNSTVDTDENTVSAETSHFSQYAVLDVARWKDTFTTVPQPNRGGGEETNDSAVKSLDVVFVLDSSGSMDGTDPQDLRATAAKRFVSALIDGDRAAVVDFDSSARVRAPLTTNRDTVNQSIDALNQVGGTNIEAGLETALDEFETNSNETRRKVAVLLTDGQDYGNADDIRQVARDADDRDITINAIGFSNANAALLQYVANTTDGSSYFADNASQLPRVFSRVAANTTGGTDSDGDGLTDATERSGFTDETLPVSVVPFSTDPNDAQTDADGLADGAEVGSIVHRSVAFTIVTDGEPFTQRLSGGNWQIHSNPTKVDTDDDGLTDDTETEGWTVPTINRSGQAYRYATNEANGSVHVDSNPRKKDSDGDVVTDRAEKFRAHTDPSGDVRYAIAGTLATRPVQLDDTRDHDQDGFPDRQEFQGIPTQVDGEFVKFETDPLNPDTDGDELHESAEFRSMTTVRRDVGPTGVQRDIFPLISDPTETDSDGDRLSDLEERTIGTDPLSNDTDEDGLTDSYDERPLIDDTPPAVKFLLTTRREGRIKVVDDSKVTVDGVEANPYYEGVGWSPSRATVAWAQQGAQDRPEYPNYYGYDFESISGGALGLADQYPDRHWVNVTNQNGTSARYLINHRKAGSSFVSRTAYSLGRQLITLPDVQSKPISSTAGVLLISTGYILENRMVVDISRPSEQSREYSVPLSDVVERYNDTEFGDLVLPRGEYGDSNRIETGRGWEFIDATDDDVTLENIGRALEPDNAIGVTLPESDDSGSSLNVGVGIAGPVDDPELVFVVIVGDTILRATAQDLQGIDSQSELDAAREFLHDDASETTKRVMTDGGLEDEEHPSALVEALDDPDVSESDIDAAVETIESLNQEEMAWDIVEEAPAPAVEFFADIHESELQGFFPQADSLSQVAEFIEALDGDAAEVIREARTGHYGSLLRMSGSELEILGEIVVDGELRGDDKLASDDITPAEIHDISGETDLTKIELIAKDPDGRVVYLTPDRWQHIVDRHVEGTETNKKADETTFFPTGKSVRSRDARPAADLPDTMSEHDVKQLVREAIERTQSSGGSYIVEATWSHYGISELQINTDGDVITTAYPNNGPDVRRWNRVKERWERWNGNEWTKWSQPYGSRTQYNLTLDIAL